MAIKPQHDQKELDLETVYGKLGRDPLLRRFRDLLKNEKFSYKVSKTFKELSEVEKKFDYEADNLKLEDGYELDKIAAEQYELIHNNEVISKPFPTEVAVAIYFKGGQNLHKKYLLQD